MELTYAIKENPINAYTNSAYKNTSMFTINIIGSNEFNITIIKVNGKCRNAKKVAFFNEFFAVLLNFDMSGNKYAPNIHNCIRIATEKI